MRRCLPPFPQVLSGDLLALVCTLLPSWDPGKAAPSRRPEGLRKAGGPSTRFPEPKGHSDPTALPRAPTHSDGPEETSFPRARLAPCGSVLRAWHQELAPQSRDPGPCFTPEPRAPTKAQPTLGGPGLHIHAFAESPKLACDPNTNTGGTLTVIHKRVSSGGHVSRPTGTLPRRPNKATRCLPVSALTPQTSVRRVGLLCPELPPSAPRSRRALQKTGVSDETRAVDKLRSGARTRRRAAGPTRHHCTNNAWETQCL